MTSRDFCYWLQGMFEIAEPTALTEKQTKLIKQHLSMVFVHEIDPSFPSEQQQDLTDAHDGLEDVGGGWGKPSGSPINRPPGIRC